METELKNILTKDLVAELAERIGGANAHERAWYQASCLAISKAGPVVVEEVAATTGVGVAEIMGRSRVEHICECRQIAMWKLRQAGFSLTQIGGFFGRDHTTVMHAIKRLGSKRLVKANTETLKTES